MHLTNSTPSIGPETLGTVYLLWTTSPPRLDGDRQRHADAESIIVNLLAALNDNPVRVVAFNVDEGWSRDVSADIKRTLTK